MFNSRDLKNLWAAVLHQTIDDIVNPSREKLSLKQFCRRKALVWIKTKSTAPEPQSFIGVCWILGLDPDDTRDRILSMPRVQLL
ncbi:MAG: hypothetical protein DRH26_00030 [Deltaproteobacteria bacterium]|nr:MAG: hypothetical protein DRH26_00030 [Deltaproteobacteria bacterium]